jgi:hypothetical protein
MKPAKFEFEWIMPSQRSRSKENSNEAEKDEGKFKEGHYEAWLPFDIKCN